MAGFFRIVRDDISNIGLEKHFKAEVLAIPASRDLEKGGGANGPIFSLAGEKKLKYECDLIKESKRIQEGDAVVTPPCNLKERGVKKLIHAVAPMETNDEEKVKQLVQKMIQKILSDSWKWNRLLSKSKAVKKDKLREYGLPICTSLALPLIGTGACEIPKETVIRIFIEEILGDIKEDHKSECEITLVTYTKNDFETAVKILGEFKDKFEKEFQNISTDDLLQDIPTQEEPLDRKLARQEAVRFRQGKEEEVSMPKDTNDGFAGWRIIRDDIRNIGLKEHSNAEDHSTAKDHFFADVVVSPSNESLSSSGGGFRDIVVEMAGPAIEDELKDKRHCDTGKAVLTDSYNLRSRGVEGIIFAVGPIYNNDSPESEKLLESAVNDALTQAKNEAFNSLVLPLISTGAYKYPPQEALDVTVRCIKKFTENADNSMKITLLIADQKIFNAAKAKYKDNIDRDYLLGKEIDTESAVNRNDRRKHDIRDIQKNEARRQLANMNLEQYLDCQAKESTSLYDTLKNLLEKACEKEKKDCKKDVTINSICSRVVADGGKFLSKLDINSREGNKEGIPEKGNFIALALVMKLSEKETEALLAAAGYTLSDSLYADRIVRWHLLNETYDLEEVNRQLKAHGCKTLTREKSAKLKKSSAES